MKNYIEKKIRKHVIATVDGQYLKKEVLKGEYCFVEDIEVATKIIDYFVAMDVLKYFYHDTGINIELVVVPVDITYELINENN